MEASRDHFKCLSGDTDVLMGDGTWKKIATVIPGEYVWTRSGARCVLDSGGSGVKSLLRVDTFGGFSIKASPDHRFMTDRGWRTLSEINVGDRMFVPMGYAKDGAGMSLDDSKLLAYVIAEGSIKTGFNITNMEPDIRGEISGICAKRGWNYRYAPKHYCSSLSANWRRGPKSPLSWARRYGVADRLAYDKAVPDSLFRGSRRAQATFINRFYACDGAVQDYGTNSKIVLTLANENLIDQVQRLLLANGIFSCKRYFGTPVAHKTYSLLIQDALNMQKFLEFTGPIMAKNHAAKSILNRARSIKRSNTRDTRHTESGSWVAVRGIYPAGIEETYDLSVEGENEFVANGILVHNSTFFSYAYPLFCVQKVKEVSKCFGIALFSYSEGQAQKNLKRVRQEIENNPQLKWLMPKVKSSVWDASTLDMSNGCYIEAYGFGSSFRGRHPKKIIIDDPCKDEGTGSMSLDQQIQFFSGVIVPAAKKDAQLLITGNPVGKKDFLEWLEQNKAFEKKFYPVLDAQGNPLAPEHYDHAAIEDKRSTIPVHNFALEYMLHRVSKENARFTEDMIHYYTEPEIQDERTRCRVPLYKIMTIDPALSPGGDALAAVVTGTDTNMCTYVIDRMAFRGDFRHGIERLVDMMVSNDPDYIGTEIFAFQAMYKIWLEEEISRRKLPFVVNEVGRDSRRKKSARIESLQPKLSQGKLKFKKEHYDIVEELLFWEPESKTNQDDLIDALAWQIPLWRKPTDYGSPRPTSSVPGSFNEAFDEIRRAGSNKSYLTHLFEDLGYQ